MNKVKERYVDDILNNNKVNKKNRGKILQLAGCVAALLVLISIGIYSINNNERVEKMNDTFLVELATGMADKISAMMLDASSLLQTSAAAIADHGTNTEELLFVLKNISAVSTFDELFISIKGDTPINASKEPLLSDSSLPLGKINAGQVYVSSPQVQTDTGRSFFVIGTSLSYENEYIGDLFGLYYLDNYASVLDLKSFGGAAFFHLCQVDGTPLVLSGNNDNLFTDGDMYSFIGSLNIQNGFTPESIQQNMEKGETTLLKYHINRDERSAVMVRVPQTDWCVVSIVLDEVTVQMARRINQSTMIFAVAMICIFAVYFVFVFNLNKKNEARLRKALISSHRLAKRLKTTVETDSLTQVYSRSTATEKIANIIERTDTEHQTHVLMIADVDNFKLINDTYGHQIGDTYLKEFVHAVNGCLRADDIFGRLGGDEFIILLHNIETKEIAKKIVVRILEQVNKIRIKDVSLDQVGISVGMVMIPRFGKDYETLNNMADKALYAAKNAGKSTFVFYSDVAK